MSDRCKECKHPLESHRVKVVTSESGRVTIYRATWRCKVGECGCKFKTRGVWVQVQDAVGFVQA